MNTALVLPGTAAACLAAGLALHPQPQLRAAEGPEAAKGAPRIGLALSGGGARGLAHIGVLKVLEELRVPVHCVTGTSMGAIVGATYASGMPLPEMEKFVIEANWDDIFRDRPPRAGVSSRRKIDDYKTLFAPEYGIKDGALALPKGVIAGISIEGFFRSLTNRATPFEDFRQLPIPFHAVAADIETGEAVVLDRGSLSQAMRASMAVPGALAPVEIGGRLLVDGGVANNLPIDEARKLCGDVVIAVNISTPPLKRGELTSALSVGTQLINFLGKATVDRQLKSLTGRDVLVEPELGDLSAASFERGADAIRIGEEAARKLSDALRRYSLSPDEFAALRSRQTVPSTALGKVDEIRFEGLQRSNPEVLRSLLDSKPGEELKEETLNADLRRIYGRGDFEGIAYRIQQEPGGRALIIQPREKEWGPDYLRFGLGLVTDFQGENIFNLLVSYRRTWLNRLGAEWLTQAQIGNNSYLATEFYQPVEERGRYFVAPYARVSQDFRGLFIGEDRVAEFRAREGRLGLDAGAVLGTWGEARLGAVWRSVDVEVDTGPEVLPGVKETSAGPRALLYIDRFDHAWFPQEGFRAIGSAYVADKAFGSDRNYKRLEGQLLGARSVGPHTLNLGVSGGTNLDTDMPVYETFNLGGPLRLSGYRLNEFSGQKMAFGRFMYYNRTIPLPDLLGAGVYVGGSLEAGQVRNRVPDQPSTGTIWSGSVFLAADTSAGPAYFGLGAGESGRWSLYLLLGAP